MPPARSASRKSSARRPRGTGSLLVRRDQAGSEIWYGKWRSGDEQVKRRIGPKRDAQTGAGLTRTEAEAQLRGLMGTVRLHGNGGGSVTVAEAGQLLLERLETKGRRRTTLGTVGDVAFEEHEWRGVFEPLADQAFFAQVRVDPEGGTIMWPNGVDMAPEPLYAEARLHRVTARSAQE